MRPSEINLGAKYLTKTITVEGGLLGSRKTRGVVRVDAVAGGECQVTWLMRDGSQRQEVGLPEWMPTRQLLAEVREA